MATAENFHSQQVFVNMPRSFNATQQHARLLRTSTSDCFLRLVEYLRRVGGKTFEQLLDFLAGSRVDIEPDLVGVSAKLAVLQGCHQGLAQRLEAIGCDARWPGNRATKQQLLEVHVEDRAIHVALGEVKNARNIAIGVGALVGQRDERSKQ